MLRASNLSKCTLPNECLYIYTSLLRYCGKSTELGEGKTEAFWVSDSPWLCDPHAKNQPPRGHSFPKVNGVKLVSSWGDFQL